MKEEKQRIKIPYGYCHCGCGGKTNLAAQSSTRQRYIRGEPIEFIKNHNARLKIPTYKKVKNGCWLWQGRLNSKGYGYRWFNSKPGRMAHRVIYELLKGPILKGMPLDHLCRVRHCVNPDHLEPVTTMENNRRSALRKLTIPQVLEIRQLIADGKKHKEIAKLYSISASHISSIGQKVVWKDGTF